MDFQAIPVIDFGVLQAENDGGNTLKELHDAFVNVGFVYLRNHGIDLERMRAVFEQVSCTHEIGSFNISNGFSVAVVLLVA